MEEGKIDRHGAASSEDDSMTSTEPADSGIGGAVWRALVDSARDAYVAIDHEGVVTEWNRRATEMFGWDHDEAVGRLLAEMIVPPEFREAHLLGVRRFVSTGQGNVAFQRLQLPALRADGRQLEVEFTILPSRGPDGRWRFHAFLHDVTASRVQRGYVRLLQRAAVAANEADSAEAAVRATLAAVEDTADIRLAHAYLAEDDVLRPAGWWFPAAMEPFSAVTATTVFELGEGLPGRVAQQKRPAWIHDLAEDHDFPRVKAALAAGLRAAFAFPVMSGDRVMAVIELFTTRPSTPDRELLDVMEAVGTQLGRVFERRQAMEQLQTLAEDRKAIVAIVGHELRGPLAAVDAAAALLAEELAEDYPESDDELVTIMQRQVARLRRLVDSFLTAQRLEAGALVVHPAPVAVAGLVRQVASDAAMDDVHVEGSDDVAVLADPDHVSQIVWNLLANSITHGLPPVDVTVVPRDDCVTVEVSDAGPGVDPAVRDQLFERFGRDPSSHGTGLGLAISRDLARVNGGDLSYGTDQASRHAFTLELPQA